MISRTSSRITDRLREAGKRITAERRLLLDIITRNPHLDASAIHRLATDVNPKIGLATVYRTLNLLAELDLVDVSTLGEAHGHYEIRGDDHVHMICLRCGVIREASPLGDPRSLVDAEDFQVLQARLELIGYCPACQQDSKSSRQPHQPEGK
jgi:Fur family ferric uptake transcriptional regulator